MTAEPLKGKGLLTPIQKAFLQAFAQLPDQGQFYLTGGTALAEYYLGHRLSFDLDFFTGVDSLILPMSYQIEHKIQSPSLQVSVIRRFASYVEFLITQDNDQLKVDLALDSPFRFFPPTLSEQGVLVNNDHDLFVDKLLAYFGRAEPRDAIDLHIILQQESLPLLLERASQKDPGFDLYWFAIALERSAGFPDEAERWPIKMLVPFNPVEIKQSFHEIAIRLMSGLTK